MRRVHDEQGGMHRCIARCRRDRSEWDHAAAG